MLNRHVVSFGLGAAFTYISFGWSDVGKEIVKTPPETRCVIERQVAIPVGSGTNHTGSRTLTNAGQPPEQKPQYNPPALMQLPRVGNLSLTELQSQSDRINAIPLLVKYGSEQQRHEVANLINDERSDIGTRIAALEEVDWTSNADAVINILRQGDGLSEAVLLKAGERTLSDVLATAIDQEAMKQFLMAPVPSMQIAILEYFIDRSPAIFDDLVPRLNLGAFREDEQTDIRQLISRRYELLQLTGK